MPERSDKKWWDIIPRTRRSHNWHSVKQQNDPDLTGFPISFFFENIFVVCHDTYPPLQFSPVCSKNESMVDHFPAFRKLRVKSAERMGQAGILRVVDQFMGHLMSAQSLFKIQSIALKIIVVTGDQETGWQTGHDVRVLRRYIGGKSTFL